MTQRQNAIWNCKNPHQGKDKKILCLCSAGLLRSPTIAKVLARLDGFNPRSAGVNDYALIPVDEVLIHWADIIICAHEEHRQMLITKQLITEDDPVVVLNIPDKYAYNDPELIKIIEQKLQEHGIIK